MQASLQKHRKRQAFYKSVSEVYFSGTRTPVTEDAQWIPTVVLGYELALTDRTNVNLQGYASRSVLSHEQTDLPELLGRKYQYSLGVRHRFDSAVFTFAVTENVENLDNTPDIGFQLGVAWLPKAIRRN